MTPSRHHMVALLVSVALVGCDATTAPPAQTSTTARVASSASAADGGCHLATGATSPMTLPDFPTDALVQYMSANREGEWRGFRVMSDGRLLRTSREGVWQEDTPLTPARLARLRDVLTQATLKPGEERFGAEPPPDDAGGWALAARVDGELATRSGLGCRPTFVDTLVAQIAPLLAP